MWGWILTLFVGGISGWLASLAMKRDSQMGVVANVTVGLIGSLIGGLIYRFFSGGPVPNLADAPLDPVSFLVSFAGALLLLLIVNLISRRRMR